MLKELNSWFAQPGAYVLVDGQFGSTGKGVMAALMAEIGKERITHVTTNAGPNSGHTAYWRNDEGGYDRVMTQQVPVASVFLRRMGYSPVTLLNAGAVIDPVVLVLGPAVQVELELGAEGKDVVLHDAVA